jgi:outer membrane immunogenic protein
MKKMMLLGTLILSAAAGLAQESRQDASVSATGTFAPEVNGNGVQMTTQPFVGFLGSYRYMLTPRSALEANYSFTQNQQNYVTSFLTGQIHQRQQEVSAAYVYNMNFKRYSPFLEGGVAGMIFSPIHDFQTTSLDTKRNTSIGALFGAGVAYELSPSFDIRVEYRGIVVKAPNFSIDNFKTNRYELISMPALGIAYHF